MTDQKKFIIAVLTILFSLVFLSTVSAVSTIPSQIILNSTYTSQQIEFDGLTSQLNLTLSSSISSYTTLNFYDVGLPLSAKWVTITLNSNVPAGNYVGSIIFDGGSIPVAINIPTINIPPVQISGCDIEIFPTLLSNIKVSQGDKKTRNIQVTVPDCYPSFVKINGVSLATDEKPIQLGELSLGNVLPGNSILIPIEIDSNDVATGQYSDTLLFSIYNSSGNKLNVPSVSIGVYVSAGISPVTNNTFSTPPTCALSATTLNLNATYSFTCSNVVSNLQIEPQYSTYFEGKKVDVSSDLYRYDFIPLKYGETDFIGVFRYNGAPIFQPYLQHVRISSSGSSIGGATLKIIFTPRLDQATGDENKFLIQLADNSSGSLVSNPRVWVNALEINSSTDTFEYPFIPNTNYEIRGKANGYDDIVQTINITPNKINILISPASGDTLTPFNITTSVDNATLSINGQTYYGSFWGNLIGGVNEIKASKDGYKTEILNFTVGENFRITGVSGEFKRGIVQNFTLNKNSTSWVVYFQDRLDSTQRTEYSRGNGNLISFTPNKNGVYVLEADGTNIGTYQIPGFSFNDKWGFLPAWAWLSIGLVISIIIFILIMRAKNKRNNPGQDGGGMSFNVGDY